MSDFMVQLTSSDYVILRPPTLWFVYCDVMDTVLAQWLNATALDLLSVGSIPTGTKLRNNLGQVVHSYMPLSPSIITWYWSKDGDVLWLGK